MAKLRPTTVLVFDDNATMRQDMRTLLDAEGYAVSTATSQGGVPNHEYDFAVINLDVTYGAPLQGLEIADRIRQVSPRTHMILMSTEKPTPGSPYCHIWKFGARDPLEALLAELAQRGGARPKRQCLVIMPFSKRTGEADDWTALFRGSIYEAVLATGRYECTRSEPPAGDLLEHLLPALLGADVVVAVLTDNNPNVFYELGLRHAEGGPTILISRHDPPATVKQNVYIKYTLDGNGAHELRQALTDALERLDSGETEYVSFASKWIAQRRAERAVAAEAAAAPSSGKGRPLRPT